MEYILIFIEGIASFISPCILPLIPLYVSYFAGSESKKGKTVRNSISFVAGFSIVFLFMAIAVNSIGIVISPFVNNIKLIFGILVIIIGLDYIGLLKINLFSKFKKIKYNLNDLNSIKSFIFGMLFAMSMTPCVGTFLSSALLLIATEGSLIKGIGLILIYCMGLGIPFIISSILIDRLKNVFNLIKKHYSIVKIVSGLVLIIMGIYLILF